MEHAFGGNSKGDPPKCGDKKFIEGQGGSLIELVYTGSGPIEGWDFVRNIPGSGAIYPTNSPIDYIAGAFKAPFALADDFAVLGFAKFSGGNGLQKILVKGTDDIIDLSKFIKVKGGNLVYKKFTIQKTLGTPHGENAIYKLYKNDKRIFTLDSTGKILRP